MAIYIYIYNICVYDIYIYAQVLPGPPGSFWVLGPRSWVSGPGSQVLGPRSSWVAGPPGSQVLLSPRSSWVPGPPGSQVLGLKQGGGVSPTPCV